MPVGRNDGGRAKRRRVGRTVTDAEGGRYRVVTRYGRPGRRTQIPSAAREVTIEPLRDGSAVRITYLRPLREIPFEDESADGRGEDGTDGVGREGVGWNGADADADVRYIN